MRSKLSRPYIPIKVRIEVVLGQLWSEGFGVNRPPVNSKRRLTSLLSILGMIRGEDWRTYELHHRPALINRRRVGRDYDPPANDPMHLVYIPATDHDIETRVRGIGAQLSDLAQARKRKRVERNRLKRAGKIKVRKIINRGFGNGVKRENRPQTETRIDRRGEKRRPQDSVAHAETGGEKQDDYGLGQGQR